MYHFFQILLNDTLSIKNVIDWTNLLLYGEYELVSNTGCGTNIFLFKMERRPGTTTAAPKVVAAAKTSAPKLMFAMAPLVTSIDFFTGILTKGTAKFNST